MAQQLPRGVQVHPSHDETRGERVTKVVPEPAASLVDLVVLDAWRSSRSAAGSIALTPGRLLCCGNRVWERFRLAIQRWTPRCAGAAGRVAAYVEARRGFRSTLAKWATPNFSARMGCELVRVNRPHIGDHVETGPTPQPTPGATSSRARPGVRGGKSRGAPSSCGAVHSPFAPLNLFLCRQAEHRLAQGGETHNVQLLGDVRHGESLLRICLQELEHSKCQTPTWGPFALLWFPRSSWSPSIPGQQLVEFGFQAVDLLLCGGNLSNQVNNPFPFRHGPATYQKG